MPRPITPPAQRWRRCSSAAVRRAVVAPGQQVDLPQIGPGEHEVEPRSQSADLENRQLTQIAVQGHLAKDHATQAQQRDERGLGVRQQNMCNGGRRRNTRATSSAASSGSR